ncbi:MAG: hypothetical protein RLN81_02155 [Balneolaceae bacterium]
MSSQKVNRLVKGYNKRILDFRSVYSIKLLYSDIENYEQQYREQLEVISKLSIEQFDTLFNYIKAEIDSIVRHKAMLGFTNSRDSGSFYLLISKELFKLNPPIVLFENDHKILCESIFISDPWGLKQPSNDDEFRTHEKWWIEVELKKHFEAFILLKTNKEKSVGLEVAKDWMDILVTEINELTLPTESDIIEKLSKVYPNFIRDFDQSLLKTKFVKGRKVIKKSVAIALCFIFQKKEGLKCTPDSILKRYQRKKYW